jgi:hypothetical protein
MSEHQPLDVYQEFFEAAQKKHLEQQLDLKDQAYIQYCYDLAMKVVQKDEITKSDVYGYLRAYLELRVAMRRERGSEAKKFQQDLLQLSDSEENGTLPHALKVILESRIGSYYEKHRNPQNPDQTGAQINDELRVKSLLQGLFNLTSHPSLLPFDIAQKKLGDRLEWESTFLPYTYQALRQGRELFIEVG